MRLIDVDKLRWYDMFYGADNKSASIRAEVVTLLYSQPEVDAEPVRHAHWKQRIGRWGYIKTVCSNCGTPVAKSYGDKKHNCYCDVCGAKMNMEEKQDV